MFDWYEPEAAITCPACGTALRQWQGKDGPCALFVWRQGVAAPVEHRVDDDCKLAPDEMRSTRLRGDVTIHSYDCGQHVVDARAVVREGVWRTTEIIDVRDAPDSDRP